MVQFRRGVLGPQVFWRKTYPAFASSKLCQFIQSLADIHILPQYSGQIEHLHQFKERNWIPAGLPITIDVFRELNRKARPAEGSDKEKHQ